MVTAEQVTRPDADASVRLVGASAVYRGVEVGQRVRVVGTRTAQHQAIAQIARLVQHVSHPFLLSVTKWGAANSMDRL